MEVHQHTHTERKKWHHYFWEFFMLFLAVTAGFFVENRREHIVERNRENQFMKSLVEDLKTDTASITRINQFRKARHFIYDSLSSAINENKIKGNEASVYFWGRIISRYLFFYSADGTIQQLKNSGGLRLISKKSVVDNIMNYDVLYRDVLHLQELEEFQMNEYRVLAGEIFDAAVFKSMINLDDTIRFSRPVGTPSLKNDSRGLLNELGNKLNYWAASSYYLFRTLEQLNEKAAALIQLIQKEYHLK